MPFPLYTFYFRMKQWYNDTMITLTAFASVAINTCYTVKTWLSARALI